MRATVTLSYSSKIAYTVGGISSQVSPKQDGHTKRKLWAKKELVEVTEHTHLFSFLLVPFSRESATEFVRGGVNLDIIRLAKEFHNM